MAGAVSNLMVRAGFDGSRLSQGLNKMQSELKGANNSVRSSMQSISSATKEANNSVKGSMQSLGSAAGMIKGALVTAAATITGYIGSIGVSYDAMQESSTVAWTTLLGSQEKAKKQIQDIANFAKNTQFDTEGVDAMAKYLNNAGYEGKKLFDQLNRVADVSGAFNISADNAKEMVRQMSQVDQAQVAYTQDLNILQDQGVPIYKAIAAELHTNVAAVRKMASEGKITSDIYDKAFNHIADTVKGSSAKQAQTFSGMMSTMKDDFAILMGVLEKPIFNALHDGMTKLLPIMDGLVSLGKGDMQGFQQSMESALGKNATNMIVGFAQTLENGFKTVKTSVQSGIGYIKDAITGIKDIFKGGAAEGTGISILDNLGFNSSQISKVQSFMGALRKALSELPGILNIFKGNTIQGIEFLTKLGLSPNTVVSITQTTVKIRDTIGGFLNDVKKIAQSYIGDLVNWWSFLVQAISGFVQGLFTGKNSIVNSFVSIFDTIKKIAMPILQDIVKFIGDEFSQIKKWWDQNASGITEAVKNFWAILAGIFKALAPALEFIIKSVWDNIKGVIDGAIKIIEGIIMVFTGVFTGNWSKVWEGIKSILGGALEAIWNAIQLLFIGKVLKGVGGFFGLIKELFSGGWSSIVNGAKLFVSDVGAWFAKFLDNATTYFDKIVDAAKNIPSGIVNGLKSGVSAVGDAIAGLANSLVDKFKSVLGIHSPSRVFMAMGGHIMDGLIHGLTNGNLMDLGKMVFSDFGGGILNTVDKIKGFLSGVFSGGASGDVAGWIQSALSIVGAPSSWLGPLSTLVQNESGGNPNAINLTDSNAKAGHPSKGLFQTIDSTFNAYAIKGLGDIYNPIANAVAGIRYIMDRYGSVFNVPGIASLMSGGSYVGYATGTGYAPGGLAMVGENGPELMYVPRGSQIKSNTATKNLLGDGLADTISSAVANALLQVMGTHKQSNSGDIVLQIDGRTFARMTKPYMDHENKRVGTNVRLQPI